MPPTGLRASRKRLASIPSGRRRRTPGRKRTASLWIRCSQASSGARYAKNKEGLPYPLDLFRRKVRKLRILAPMSLYGVMFVSEFEKLVYETEDLDAEKVMWIAKDMRRKYMDYSEDSLWALTVPHIYSSGSSAYSHAYGLAELALEQWRDYFYEKYDYIVDNPSVGKEMREVWKLGSQPFSTPHCSPVQQTCLFPKRPYTQKVILGDCRKQPQDRNPHRGFCWFGGSPS